MNPLQFSLLLPDEGKYAEWMNQTVEPYLSTLRKDGFFVSENGAELYYFSLIPSNPLGSVVIVHGFTESAEKYNEMCYWFLQMGYAVFALDQRGHGKSFRMSEDFALTDVEHFYDYVTDLHHFMEDIVIPSSGNLPLYLYGHSMGGAVSVLYLQDHPECFSKAILTGPMLKPKTSGYPSFFARTVSAGFRLFGKGGDRVFAYKPGFDENELFKNSPATSEPRFEYYRRKRVAFRHLQNTYPSYRWLNESLRIVKTLLNPKRCARVQTPTLLFSAGNDTLVYRKEQEQFISQIPHGQIVYKERARHEIYLSPNDIMAGYLSEIEGFLKSGKV